MTNPFLNHSGDRSSPGEPGVKIQSSSYSSSSSFLVVGVFLRTLVKHFSFYCGPGLMPWESRWAHIWIKAAELTTEGCLSVHLPLSLFFSVMVLSLGFNTAQTWRLTDANGFSTIWLFLFLLNELAGLLKWWQPTLAKANTVSTMVSPTSLYLIVTRGAF